MTTKKRGILPTFKGPDNIVISDREFQKLSDLVKRTAGIHLTPAKKDLVKARLGKFLRSKGLKTFAEYYAMVLADTTQQSLIEFIDALSTNLTSFFREKAHLDFLAEKGLPEIVELRRRDLDRAIRIWSAGCSSGEEPYSIAITLEKSGILNNGWRQEIFATDICTNMLARAKRGIYESSRVSGLDQTLLKLFFQKGYGKYAGYVKVKDHIRQVVSFSRVNLMDEFMWNKPFDVIFCRNVMIYFDKPTQERLVNKFYKHLRPGGFLFIGHSENLSGIRHHLRHAGTAIYQKNN